MGFDAIWISPYVQNTGGDKSYHGYWMQSLYIVNPYFGTAEDLKALVDECHKRDIWVIYLH
ncbi:glycoside hydrolase, family 13, partial [Kipferlia bialata]|eukprot:g17356.t1